MIEDVVKKLSKKGKTISTMESCTGGFIISSFTDVPGASNITEYSAVTYSNKFKVKMGVPISTIEKYTVYSKETARAMAKAICNFSKSDYGIGVTGKLGVSDSNNPAGHDNEVFTSIYDKENDKYFDLNIFVKGNNRKEDKKLILDNIISSFLKIL